MVQPLSVSIKRVGLGGLVTVCWHQEGWSGWFGHCLLLVLASRGLVWVVRPLSVSIKRVGLGGLVIVW